MVIRGLILAALLCSGPAAGARAQAPAAKDRRPILRLDAGGPTSSVTALAFSPDGTTLYAAGFDKLVRVWKRDAAGRFAPDSTVFRVPIGPDLSGSLNAIAVSPDGRWLAAAGNAMVQGTAGFDEPGLLAPWTRSQRADPGTIYLFDTRNPQAVRLLRGHLGPVLALAFAPDPRQPPVLGSVALERQDESSPFAGVARLWDVTKGALRATQDGLSGPSPWRPGLALWRAGERVRMAITWPDSQGDGQLYLWETGADQGQLRAVPDGKYNLAAAYLSTQDRLLTTSFRAGGRLQAWGIPLGQPPHVDPTRPSLVFPSEGPAHFFPWA